MVLIGVLIFKEPISRQFIISFALTYVGVIGLDTMLKLIHSLAGELREVKQQLAEQTAAKQLQEQKPTTAAAASAGPQPNSVTDARRQGGVVDLLSFSRIPRVMTPLSWPTCSVPKNVSP